MKKRIQASTSFRKDEIYLINSLFETLRRGGDVRVLMRNPAFVSFAGKIFRMKRKFEEVSK